MEGLVFLESVKKMPLMDLPVRSTFVKTNSGSVLFSPGSCLASNQIQELENVTDIVSPNFFHCAGVSKASSVFPAARKWVPSGGHILKPEIQWTDELSAESWPYQDELPMVLLNGIPRINEVVFIHKKSKSLIVADLCFNLVDVRGIGSWIILNLFGTYKKFATSQFFVRFINDKEAFGKSLSQVFSYDFENIIVGHGQNIIGNGKSKLLKALEDRGVFPR